MLDLCCLLFLHPGTSPLWHSVLKTVCLYFFILLCWKLHWGLVSAQRRWREKRLHTEGKSTPHHTHPHTHTQLKETFSTMSVQGVGVQQIVQKICNTVSIYHVAVIRWNVERLPQEKWRWGRKQQWESSASCTIEPWLLTSTADLFYLF